VGHAGLVVLGLPARAAARAAVHAESDLRLSWSLSPHAGETRSARRD
jgi:hypothetical protein